MTARISLEVRIFMSTEESQDNQQEQQRIDHDQLRSDRKARGELRNAHLEAGREQARSDNARARERVLIVPPSPEEISDSEYEAEYEAGYKARKVADEASMKAEARRRYEGSDDAFEHDWPDIREKLVMEKLEKDLRNIHRGL